MNPSLDATFSLRRSRILLRLQGLGWPSMANPFGGKNIGCSSVSASPLEKDLPSGLPRSTLPGKLRLTPAGAPASP